MVHQYDSSIGDSAIGYFKTEQPYPCTFIVYNYLSQCKDFVIQVKFIHFYILKTIA